jgi:chromosome segregation ATPase
MCISSWTDWSNKIKVLERDLPGPNEIEEYNQRIEEIDKAKFEIAKSINGLEQECESLESQLNKLAEQLGNLQLKKIVIEQEATSDLPAIRFSWSLYSNLSNIRWDYENAQVKGCKINNPNTIDLTSNYSVFAF